MAFGHCGVFLNTIFGIDNMHTKEFVYKEKDNNGIETLKTISTAAHFNNWMYQTIKPFLKGNILEIGSGIGNITQYVLDDKYNTTASDLRTDYCTILGNRFAGNAFLQGVKNIDIVHPDFEQKHSDLLNTFDSIFALNIIEHVENDVLAIENCKKLLKENGNLIILVPAYAVLYNGFDTELKHYRRYTKSNLQQLLQKADFTIVSSQYFNLAGIAGWWFTGSLLRRKLIPVVQMKIFDLMVPIFKLADWLVMNKMGLSVIAIGTKSNFPKPRKK